MDNILEKLQQPFKSSEIEWRVGSTNSEKTKGLALAYVTNRAIQNRLDNVFGVFGWQNQYREWKGTSQVCGISVYDDSKKEWITKWDGADDSATEAVKGGLSDSMKRAAYQWGIGRYLYELPNTWAELKPMGKSYVLVAEPSLPAWALPEGEPPTKSKKNIVPPIIPIEDIPPILQPRINSLKAIIINDLALKHNLSSTLQKSIEANYHVKTVEELSETQGDFILIWLNKKVNNGTTI